MKTISDYIFDTEDGRGNITLDTSIYSLKAINAAAYSFIGDYHILVTQGDPNNTVIVVFEAKQHGRDINLDLKDFCNNLIDHQVREQLDLTNGKIRDLIVAHAFLPLDIRKEASAL